MKSARKIFSENLQKLINERKIDQRELAKRIGVTPSSVSQWINGDKYPRIDKIQKIADFFNVPKSRLTEENSNIFNTSFSYYKYINIAISAGLPMDVDPVEGKDVQKIIMPDSVMGKWAGSKELFMMRINGDSMSNVMPHNSLIAVKKIELQALKDGDIVVYSDGVSYAVKRFFNDKQNKRLIFRPDSKDDTFADYIVAYENANNIKIHGKVVLYIVEL